MMTTCGTARYISGILELNQDDDPGLSALPLEP
jgi:hypothetical protein